MAYTWTDGELITAEKLNSTGGMLVVGSTYDESTQIETLDKTYKEIVDAFNAGQNVVLKRSDGSGTTNIDLLVSYGSIVNAFGVTFSELANNVKFTFIADSENGYPSGGFGGGGSD